MKYIKAHEQIWTLVNQQHLPQSTDLWLIYIYIYWTRLNYIVVSVNLWERPINVGRWSIWTCALDVRKMIDYWRLARIKHCNFRSKQGSWSKSEIVKKQRSPSIQIDTNKRCKGSLQVRRLLLPFNCDSQYTRGTGIQFLYVSWLWSVEEPIQALATVPPLPPCGPLKDSFQQKGITLMYHNGS